jgi:hypothetical protein
VPQIQGLVEPFLFEYYQNGLTPYFRSWAARVAIALISPKLPAWVNSVLDEFVLEGYMNTEQVPQKTASQKENNDTILRAVHCCLFYCSHLSAALHNTLDA